MPPDLNSLTIVLLKQQLKKRGITHPKGKKKALVEMLEECVAAEKERKEEQAQSRSRTANLSSSLSNHELLGRIHSLKVTELKAALRARQLPISGLKNVLKERLLGHLRMVNSASASGPVSNASLSHAPTPSAPTTSVSALASSSSSSSSSVSPGSSGSGSMLSPLHTRSGLVRSRNNPNPSTSCNDNNDDEVIIIGMSSVTGSSRAVSSPSHNMNNNSNNHHTKPSHKRQKTVLNLTTNNTPSVNKDASASVFRAVSEGEGSDEVMITGHTPAASGREKARQRQVNKRAVVAIALDMDSGHDDDEEDIVCKGTKGMYDSTLSLFLSLAAM